MRHGRSLIFSIRGIARSLLHRTCSLILDIAIRCRRRRYTRVHHFIIFCRLSVPLLHQRL
ncbi:hypothetical protein AHAS_Ahas11G0120200 [Arachis hypogaea]